MHNQLYGLVEKENITAAYQRSASCIDQIADRPSKGTIMAFRARS